MPLAFGLFHPSALVRSQVVDLLSHISSHPIGKKYIQTLNTFQRLALARLMNERLENIKAKEKERAMNQNKVDSVYSFPHSPGPIGSLSGWPRAFGSTNGLPTTNSNIPGNGKDLNSKFDSLAPSTASPTLG